MYRRIEFILDEQTLAGHYRRKGGIMHSPTLPVVEAWADMPGPRKHLKKNSRFYFTEHGWDVYGRATVAAAKAAGADFRIRTIKESSVDCFYADDYQVAVRPRKRFLVAPKNGEFGMSTSI